MKNKALGRAVAAVVQSFRRRGWKDLKVDVTMPRQHCVKVFVITEAITCMGGSIASGSTAVEVELGVTGVPMVNEVYGRPCREWGWDCISRIEDAVKLMR